MSRIARFFQMAIVCLVLQGVLTGLSEAQQPNTNSVAVPSTQAMSSYSVPAVNTTNGSSADASSPDDNRVMFPLYNAINPNFGGFRVAPSTPAHSSGDTTRELSAVRADFNQDGCQDIVSFQVATLTVLQGDCRGHFTNIGSESTAMNVYHPVAVDLNHDGYADIVAMTQPFGYAGTVVALLNQKNGTFSSAVVISKKTNVYSGLMDMNVYDINGDGNPDVIISGLGTTDASTNSSLVFEVIFGNADGSFNTSSLVETDATISYKPTFAYDGGTALRVTNGQLYLYGLFIQAQRVYDENFGSEAIYRWPVSASGRVDTSNPVITTLPSFSSSPNKYINFADLDGDGITDLTILNGDGQLYTALGKADGSFGTIAAALPPDSPNFASVVSFQDVNGDGKVDAILAGEIYVGVWPGNGDGTFGRPTTTYFAGYGANANSGLVFPVTNHIIYDFDGDGSPDVAFFDTPKRALSFYKGVSDGTFIGAPALASKDAPYPGNVMSILAAPDLNGDGIKDAISYSPYYGFLSGISDGKGGYSWKMLTSLVKPTAVSPYTADFNKDGREDTVFTTVDQSNIVHVWIGLSNGDGTITPKQLPYPVLAPYVPTVLVGDINGDGSPDIALALNNYVTLSYGVWPMLNDGTGNFTAGTFLNDGKSASSAALADTNNDGMADLIICYGSVVSVFPGTAAGFGSTPLSQPASVYTSLMYAQDVTGDGKIDLLISTTSGLMLMTGNGDGTFSSGAYLVSGVPVSFIGSADLNGDQVPDIFFSNAETSFLDTEDSLFGLDVLLGAGKSTFSAPQHFNIYGASTRIFAVDRYNNGSPDLLAAGGGSASILHNNGASTVAVKSSATTATTASAVAVIVSVSPYFSDQPLPTGYVTLLVDGTTNNRLSVASNGTAAFTLSGLTAGTHALTATYEGDTNYNVNTRSGTAALTITKATPAFSLTAQNGTVSLQQGGSGSSILSLTANNAFGGPVTLSCAGLPAYTACSFSNSNVTLAPGQTVNVTMALVSSGSAALHMSSGAGGSVTFCALLMLLPLARRRRGLGTLVAVSLSVVTFFSLVGCSGRPRATTPVGTYAVTMTAAPGDPTTSPQSVTLNVSITK